MVATSGLYEVWASLLHYPKGNDSTLLPERITILQNAYPGISGNLQPLLDYAACHSETELEEVFTRTFDGNAERALELGWHLHGENYARGVFMVRMRKLLRDAEVEESTELPDHLSHVLYVLARSIPEVSGALATGVVSPALAKIIDGFSNKENPYLGVITGLKRFIDGEAIERPTSAGPHAEQRHE